MRYLILTLALALFAANFSCAQDGEVTAEDYEQLIESAFEVEFRKLAIETLNLDEEQIEDFTPLYMTYMEEKAELMEDREALMKEHKDEMSENQSAEQVDDETADFVENYWEIDIEEMEVEKDFFDQFEDIMTYQKALRFFELEKGFRDRLARAMIAEYVPVLIELEPVYVAYEQQKRDYSNWKTINIDGEVGLDHNFTHDGLTKLLTYAEAMVQHEGITVMNFNEKKSKIIKLADELQKNWKSGEHADKAREAFIMTAGLMKEIYEDADLDINQKMVTKLEDAASRINGEELMTNQKEHVYAFFERAEMLLNSMANKASMADYEGYSMND